MDLRFDNTFLATASDGTTKKQPSHSLRAATRSKNGLRPRCEPRHEAKASCATIANSNKKRKRAVQTTRRATRNKSRLCSRCEQRHETKTDFANNAKGDTEQKQALQPLRAATRNKNGRCAGSIWTSCAVNLFDTVCIRTGLFL